MKGEKHSIVVEAVSNFVAEESLPQAQRYVFAYTITIHNLGGQAARLLSRYWLITDADGRNQEVRGEGVVGMQPRLEPGQAFRYTSAAMLPTPAGIMRGSYRMVDEDGEQFDTDIPPFTLAAPRTLH